MLLFENKNFGKASTKFVLFTKKYWKNISRCHMHFLALEPVTLCIPEGI